MNSQGRKGLVLLAMTAALVLMPFLFWRATWFGGKLSDAELERYLSDAKPRNVQHALAQAAERLIRGEMKTGAAAAWAPKVAGTANHPMWEIRNTAAWVMGQDNSSGEFHEALLRLLKDPEPLVRRNAALSLVRFADLSSRPELLAMLRPFPIESPESGTVTFRLRVEETANPGTLLASLTAGSGRRVDVRAPLPGRVARILVKDGQEVKAGERLLELAPASGQAWESLRALVMVGLPEDLPVVEQFTRSPATAEQKIRDQAELTARAIRSRGITPQRAILP